MVTNPERDPKMTVNSAVKHRIVNVAAARAREGLHLFIYTAAWHKAWRDVFDRLVGHLIERILSRVKKEIQW